MQKQLNIFVIYKGIRTLDYLLERLDEIKPSNADGTHNVVGDSYLIVDDTDQPKQIMDNLHFAMDVFPWLADGERFNSKYALHFCNFPTTSGYEEIKQQLEQRGYKFEPLSENIELLQAAFQWYCPVNDGSVTPYKRHTRKHATEAFVLLHAMENNLEEDY